VKILNKCASVSGACRAQQSGIRVCSRGPLGAGIFENPREGIDRMLFLKTNSLEYGLSAARAQRITVLRGRTAINFGQGV
jgi:hypothetical protein